MKFVNYFKIFLHNVGEREINLERKGEGKKRGEGREERMTE